MITVFTPTYNRAGLVKRLYQSLMLQTCYDFEWIVVDDGSTDNTQQVFDEIVKRENPFQIKYLKQTNGGKHRAINRGLKEAGGFMFFIVDSDDYLVPNAIQKVIEWEKSLDKSKKWAGVSGLRGYDTSNPIGGFIDGSCYVDAKNTERKNLGLMGDKAEVYYTHVLKENPFPEFDGENFITEEVVWDLLAIKGYYVRWYNEIIYICNYLEGGLTESGDKKYLLNPQGVLYWLKIQFKAYPRNFRKKAAAVFRYYSVSKEKKTKSEIAKEAGISVFRLYLFIITVSLGRKIKKLLQK